MEQQRHVDLKLPSPLRPFGARRLPADGVGDRGVACGELERLLAVAVRVDDLGQRGATSARANSS